MAAAYHSYETEAIFLKAPTGEGWLPGLQTVMVRWP